MDKRVEDEFQRARLDAGCKSFLFVTIVVLVVVLVGIAYDALDLSGVAKNLAVSTRIGVALTLIAVLAILSRHKSTLTSLVVVEAVVITALTFVTAITRGASEGMAPGDYTLPTVMVAVGFLFLLPSTPRTWFVMIIVFVTGNITTLWMLVGEAHLNTVIFTGVQSTAGILVAAYLGFRDKLRQREEFASIEMARVLAKQLSQLATTDSLTGVANRREFFHMASKEISRAQRNDRVLSVLMFDIDHFKKINDQYGHAAGDEVLVNIASICKKVLREIDTIGRLGGEEFGILLPETDIKEAAMVAERLRESMKLIRPGGSATTGTVTMSLGVAQWHASHEDFEELMARADRALYGAKRGGRNRVSVAD